MFNKKTCDECWWTDQRKWSFTYQYICIITHNHETEKSTINESDGKPKMRVSYKMSYMLGKLFMWKVNYTKQ